MLENQNNFMIDTRSLFQHKVKMTVYVQTEYIINKNVFSTLFFIKNASCIILTLFTIFSKKHIYTTDTMYRTKLIKAIKYRHISSR